MSKGKGKGAQKKKGPKKETRVEKKAGKKKKKIPDYLVKIHNLIKES